jgi:hypothetical protein
MILAKILALWLALGASSGKPLIRSMGRQAVCGDATSWRIRACGDDDGATTCAVAGSLAARGAMKAKAAQVIAVIAPCRLVTSSHRRTPQGGTMTDGWPKDLGWAPSSATHYPQPSAVDSNLACMFVHATTRSYTGTRWLCFCTEILNWHMHVCKVSDVFFL